MLQHYGFENIVWLAEYFRFVANIAIVSMLRYIHLEIVHSKTGCV